MIPRDQEWLSTAQVGAAFGHNAEWTRDQIAKGKSNRAGTTGIPARLVRKVGGEIHVHRSFVFPAELQPTNIVPFTPSIDSKAIAREVLAELFQVLATAASVEGRVA